MMRSLLLIGVVAAVLAGCSRSITRQERAVQEQALSERVAEWARTLNNRGQNALAEFYYQGPELTVAWPTGNRTRGWEEKSAALADFFHSVARLNIVVQEVTIDLITHDVALATFRHSADIILTTTDRDIFTGQGTMVWVKDPDDEIWRIRAEQVSRDPPSM